MPVPQTVKSGEGVNRDEPLDKPPRPCANCRKLFQPTLMRRLLCLPCFRGYIEPMGAKLP